MVFKDKRDRLKLLRVSTGGEGRSSKKARSMVHERFVAVENEFDVKIKRYKPWEEMLSQEEWKHLKDSFGHL